MRLILSTFLATWLSAHLTVVLAAPSSSTTHSLGSSLYERDSVPTIKLAQGTLQGIRQTVDGVELDLFLGVPYAKPPVGPLRFAPPVPVPTTSSHHSQSNPKDNVIDASQYGPACIYPGAKVPINEDCLTINIIRPSSSNAHHNDKLPVLQWIYGGAFTTGASSLYNGTRIVASSVQAGNPVIFVSANYRVGAWGFMASTEVTSASRKDSSRTTLNAGLYDQRLALRWTHNNIGKIGGDAGKVTIWGQSAGAISVGIQLIANGGNTENLFHAAFMTSGSPGYGGVLPPTHPRLDATYKNLTDAVGCGDSRANASSISRLDCLRLSNSSTFTNAVFAIYASATTTPPTGNLAWAPQIDGHFISDQPSRVYASGKVADVPIISGDKNDEGTTIVTATNVPDEAAFKKNTRGFLVVNETPQTDNVLSKLYELYPNDVTLGSPYTSLATNGSQATADPSDPLAAPSTNQFKRLAALFGDYAFHSQRRNFLTQLEYLKSKGKRSSPIWSYLDRQIDFGTNATRGAYHGSDIVYYFNNTIQRNSSTLVYSLQKPMQRALLSFVNFHDPTKLDKLEWPMYGKVGYLKHWEANNITVIRDDYRKQAISYWFESGPAKVLNF